jgi:hypothetical protein
MGGTFSKISGTTRQVNGVVLQDTLENKSVNFKIPAESSSVLSDIDAELLTQAKTSRVEWFGKELSDETIQNAFQESVSRRRARCFPRDRARRDCHDRI